MKFIFKKQLILLNIMVMIMMVSLCANTYAQNADLTKLKGPYLGQKPPGETPEIFAPGIISTEANEHGFPAFSPDGKEVFWSRRNGDLNSIYYMKQVNGIWTKPDIAWFSGKISEGNVVFNYTGDRIYFCNNGSRVPEGEVDPGTDIWFLEKGPTGWSGKKM